jgi:hypothetical protein
VSGADVKIRVWAAVLVDGEVRCDVRDVDRAVIGETDEPEVYRPWCYEVVELGVALNTCKRCRPGAACKRHHKQAAKYWITAHQRDTERRWFAVANCWPRPNGWRADDFGPKRATPGEAERDARAKSWNRYICQDGHGKLIETRPVSS